MNAATLTWPDRERNGFGSIPAWRIARHRAALRAAEERGRRGDAPDGLNHRALLRRYRRGKGSHGVGRSLKGKRLPHATLLIMWRHVRLMRWSDTPKHVHKKIEDTCRSAGLRSPGPGLVYKVVHDSVPPAFSSLLDAEGIIEAPPQWAVDQAQELVGFCAAAIERALRCPAPGPEIRWTGQVPGVVFYPVITGACLHVRPYTMWGHQGFTGPVTCRYQVDLLARPPDPDERSGYFRSVLYGRMAEWSGLEEAIVSVLAHRCAGSVVPMDTDEVVLSLPADISAAVKTLAAQGIIGSSPDDVCFFLLKDALSRRLMLEADA